MSKLSTDFVIGRLETCTLAHRQKGTSNRVPIAAIASLCEVDRDMLYLVMCGKRAMPVSLSARLDAVLTSIEAGELTFRRVGQVWEAEYHTPPNPLPPPQDRMVSAADFIEWARCRSCAGSRFTRVTLHGAPAHWYLCDTCSWWETAGLGAKPVKQTRRK
jgi:hypothetical protein